jgi:microcompartment protein CcmK/EutM
MRGYSKQFIFIGLCLVAMFSFIIPTMAQDNEGFAVTCDNGAEFNNGVEILVNQMRAGFTYTATAIGIGDFDPVLAVLDANGQGLCADDTKEASNYSVDLPTSGLVPASSSSAQVLFSQTSGQDMADVSLVVGSIGDTSGEFVLLLEGMAATSADGSGDPFSVRLTPGMVNSGVPLTVYMISVTGDLDPLIARIDADYNYIYDGDQQVYCDDSGDASLCWGDSTVLNNSYVTRRGNEKLGGFEKDAMISLPLDGLTLDPNPDFRFINYLMTSYEQSSFGDYVLAFHIGTGGKGGKGQGGTKPTLHTPTPVPETPNNNNGSGDTSEGVSVSCDSGVSFDNGVEIIVNSMRAGFTYTATAIGVGDFDPVLAVLDSSGNGLCTDNAREASGYSVDLPTSGLVPSSNTSAQVLFSQTSGQNMADVSLVVGSVGNSSGQFVLILEGMAATSADGSGDPFSVRLTPGMVASGVPLTVYMISVTDALDPLIARIDSDFNVVNDTNGNAIVCDDAGDTSLCWGDSSPLSGSYVTRRGNQKLGGFGSDAMLSLPLTGMVLDPDPDLRFVNYLMTSYQQSTFGDYVLAFHVGIGGAKGNI